MKLRMLAIIPLLTVAINAASQSADDINIVDKDGNKQGHWIKKYPNNATMYEATFLNNKPVGVFKRFNTDNSLKSVLIYSKDSRVADATFYHPNGFISSKGKYIDQKKEGKWSFYSFSDSGCLVNEEYYSGNLRNGVSLKFYCDSTPAEKINYRNDIKEGEWLRYHPNGKLLLKAFYVNGLLDGKFETWFDNGRLQYSGIYKKNIREGKWRFYEETGTLKYEISYTGGVTDDPGLDAESEPFFEMIENNKGKIPDPEKTGVIR